MVAKSKSERREHFRTSSGIELPVDFNPSNAEPIEYDRDLGDPGQFPYTRGIRHNMYRGRLWTMRQYAGFGDAEESNRRYRYLFANGQTGLSVAFDLPTQMGRDADHMLARGEVGRVGVSICRPRLVWTRTIRWRPAKSAKSAWRSIRCKTCCGCSKVFHSMKFRLR